MLLFDENKLDEMCKILDNLQKYVPSTKIEVHVPLPDGQVLVHNDHKLYQLLLGGDQLTIARVRGAIGVRSNYKNSKERLEGIIPVTEDWHTRQILMQVRTCII